MHFFEFKFFSHKLNNNLKKLRRSRGSCLFFPPRRPWWIVVGPLKLVLAVKYVNRSVWWKSGFTLFILNKQALRAYIFQSIYFLFGEEEADDM